MIRIAICEDNLSELQMQKQIIQSVMMNMAKNVEVFCFQSGEDLLFEIDTTGNMDIIFMDVEMSGISGIETAKLIRKRDTRAILIFVSCHNQYYREIIEVQPYAFIDKPVSEKRIEQILRNILETGFDFTEIYIFTYNKKLYNIPLMQIRFFQSDKRIIRLDTIYSSPVTNEYMFYGKLEEVEERVNKTNVKFLRIRKSFLVNSRFITEYSAEKVVLDNGMVVEISKKYKENVRQYYLSVLRGREWECW